MQDQQHQYYDLIAKFLAGECSPEENAIVDDLLQHNDHVKKLFQELSMIWDAEETITIPEPELIWQKVEAEISTPKSGQMRLLISIAASVAILVVAALIFWPRTTIEEVLVQTTDQVQEISLPDGSKAWINTNSQIRYVLPFEERTIQLDGEALFDVVKKEGSDFVVQSEEFNTTVLGTVFSVNTKSTHQSVSVIEGSVRVESINQQTTITGGQRVIYDDGILEVGTMSTSNVISWQSKKIEFDDHVMAVVASDLEELYDVTVEFSDPLIANCQFTGVFTVDALDEMIESIEFALDLTSRRNGNAIEFIGKGCSE